MVHLFGSRRSMQFIKPGAHYRESEKPEVRINPAAKSAPKGVRRRRLRKYPRDRAPDAVPREYRQHRTEIARQISSIIFCQIDKIDAGILTYFKEILAKMTENLPKDGVQSRQAVAQRCCLKSIVCAGVPLARSQRGEPGFPPLEIPPPFL